MSWGPKKGRKGQNVCIFLQVWLSAVGGPKPISRTGGLYPYPSKAWDSQCLLFYQDNKKCIRLQYIRTLESRLSSWWSSSQGMVSWFIHGSLHDRCGAASISRRGKSHLVLRRPWWKWLQTPNTYFNGIPNPKLAAPLGRHRNPAKCPETLMNVVTNIESHSLRFCRNLGIICQQNSDAL